MIIDNSSGKTEIPFSHPLHAALTAMVAVVTGASHREMGAIHPPIFLYGIKSVSSTPLLIQWILVNKTFYGYHVYGPAMHPRQDLYPTSPEVKNCMRPVAHCDGPAPFHLTIRKEATL